ncbi:MAG: O-antigen ligase family protein [Opitutaceae bacterium]|jgi:O-antigen ligase|nr:O-antigen ligase family protein [Opitutaceae bacterium]
MELHPLEKLLLFLAGAHLCLLPWMFGAMHVWSQLASLGLAFAGFAVALLPRRHAEVRAPGGGTLTVPMWPRLLRFPVFWLGLPLLGYMLVQALNPESAYTVTGYLSYGRPLYKWTLAPLAYVEWLPSGVAAPLTDAEMGTWRALLIYGQAWLVACAMWTGITRRSSIVGLLTAVVVNAAVFAAVGIAQRFANSLDMLWFLPAPRHVSYWFAGIIYKNHAGAYMNLAAAISTGLLCRHIGRGDGARGRPAPLFALFNILLGIAIFITQSRGAFFLFAAYTALSLPVIIVRGIRARDGGRVGIVVFAAVAAVLIPAAVLSMRFLDIKQYTPRYESLLKKWAEDRWTEDASYVLREKTREITLEMAKDRLWLGWGAGSFRYIYPSYARRLHPEVLGAPGRDRRWEYAHNDYVQFLAEFGVVGSSLAALLLGSGLVQLIRRRFWRYPHIALMFLGLLVTLAHCWVDFQSHNPAILLLWCGAAALLVRWAGFEGYLRHRRSSPD